MLFPFHFFVSGLLTSRNMEARGSEDSFDSRGFVITTMGLCVEWREFGRLAINNNGNYNRKIDKISAEIVGC